MENTKKILDAIYDAIDKKKAILIKYNGGSRPGTIRGIQPLGIAEDKVKAICLATEHVKFFSLGKMALLSEKESPVQWDKAEKAEKENTTFHSLQEFLDRKRAELESLGYIVMHDEKSINLHRLEKNKTSKYPYASIIFSEFEILPNYYTEEVTQEKIPREKPWDVSCALKRKQSFKEFEKASKAFYQRALQLADTLEKEGQG